jgi:gamma-glutamylcyclotransferase (GGCT)/AIG2-like uncharacterized protein YtfP
VTLPLFVYGSLRDSDVRARVLGARSALVTIVPATLHGHARITAPGFAYPFLVPTDEEASRVDGELLLGLTDADYVVLDAYEDTDDGLYVRAEVTAETEDGGVTAYTYLRGPFAPR